MNSPTTHAWTSGHVLLGEYRVERLLGVGGMGQVYLVRSRSTGQPFAVKRARPGDAGTSRKLLAELRAWTDLPGHPHLAACRFFRTVADEIAIFAEYVEGGTLSDWIHDRKLSDDASILDVAIQLAWGLAAAHERGIVHQDVKPGNVLMTSPGVAKVTDFGLARHTFGGSGSAAFGGAMSRPYCSPEQAALAAGAGGGLTPHSDMWSWGVAVLEMFMGESPCRYGGHVAAESLEQYLQRGGCEPGFPALPPFMATVLRKCFQPNPADRWSTMAELAGVVKIAYKLSTGSDYLRVEPESLVHGVMSEVSRRTAGGTTWEPPQVWLRRVLRAAGRDPDAVEPPHTLPARSRKASAIADLALFDEAYRLAARIVTEGRKDLAPLLARLCIEKAAVHRAADDPPGAADLFGEAERLLSTLHLGEPDLASDLVRAILDRGDLLRVGGRYQAAVEACDRALAVCEAHAAKDERSLGFLFVESFLDRGRALHALGDYHAALAACERALIACEALARSGQVVDRRAEMASIFVGKARAFRSLGETAAATAWLDRAIPLYEQLVREDGKRFSRALGSAYQSKANLLSELNDAPAAADYYDRAIALWERLAQEHDDPDLVSEAARTCANKALLLRSIGEFVTALTLCDRAIAVFERLTGVGGQQALVPELAWVYQVHAGTLLAAGDAAQAVGAASRSVDLLEPLATSGERADLAADLAYAHQMQARACFAAGAAERALSSREACVLILERLVRDEGRWDLGGDLVGAYQGLSMTLVSVGRGSDAVTALDRALAAAEWLIDSRGQQNLQSRAMNLRIDRAELFIELGQPERAQAELYEVLSRVDSGNGDEAIRRRALDGMERLW